VHPLGYQVLHWSLLPLWCHVADASDGGEVEAALVLLDEALDLVAVYPGDPGLDDVPAELFDPLDSSEGWHGTVGVAREEEHLDVGLVLHDSIDPERALVLLMPVLIYRIIAVNPRGIVIIVERIVDFQDIFYFLDVEVVGDGVAEDIIILQLVFNQW